MMMSGEQERGDQPARGMALLLVGAALAISAGLVWLATGQMGAVAGFVGGALVLGAAGVMLGRGPGAAPDAEPVEPDWSVTVAAIEGDAAVAIVDRAGRLVCANGAFEAGFGAWAPPALPFGDAAGALEDLARAAWRDGAAADGVTAPDGTRWRIEVARAGRTEAYLIWRLRPVVAPDPVGELCNHLAGKLGVVLGHAGFCAALVETNGQIRAANHAFAQRSGAEGALVGQPFIGLLAQDEQDRIFWAHDVKRSVPLTLFYLPLVDPDGPDLADPQQSPSLMLLVDQGVGLGGSGEVSAAVPHLQALLGGLPLGLAMADRDGRLLFANAAFMRAAGREGGDVPTYPTDLVVREDKAALADAVRRFGYGAATSGDVAVRLAAQPEDPVSLSLAGVRGLGEAAVLLGLTDTTEETRLKRQVAQATKMQAVGQLAGGVAHDFNNVLTAIIGTCDLMLLRHTPGDSDYDDIQQIRANSNRAASLTRQLLAFSRQQTLRPQVLQLPDIVSDITQMLRRLIGEKIRLEVSHDRDLGAVRADPTQVEQVIVNLVVNARDAMQEASRKVGGDGSGALMLATRRVPAADVRAMGSDILPIADYTALVVRDTGGGIPGDILGKIWEPFFTTKEQGRGTGLGLSTVYGIVKQSGGFIFADNVPAQDGVAAGARFTVYLPVHHGAAEVAARPLEEATAWAGGGDILLVEDEDAVRVVAERALSRAGYQVTTASDGEEGVEAVMARRDSGAAMFDMVVSDVVMPVMDGPAMARAIRGVEPDLPVLFMSGYAEEQLRREIDIVNMYFIPKPFSVNQIAGKVAGVLAKRAGKKG
ncbi:MULTISPECIES: response regulator [unclassified Novosphingobium]|uniref:response regulator n=1 Tax=unclassified Novosphingobium TaxID=2644732 RepID=UPI000B140B39|nr:MULTISPECIES: response regulator [unclassified Novosphingobium]MBN9144186.1 response regulator [Novosphingobium sp.]MDR6708481.1 two-component system cell cycle sensor histidine kinase/response regulator CckA [Novosphingobium sp. 1748]